VDCNIISTCTCFPTCVYFIPSSSSRRLSLLSFLSFLDRRGEADRRRWRRFPSRLLSLSLPEEEEEEERRRCFRFFLSSFFLLSFFSFFRRRRRRRSSEADDGSESDDRSASPPVASTAAATAAAVAAAAAAAAASPTGPPPPPAPPRPPPAPGGRATTTPPAPTARWLRHCFVRWPSWPHRRHPPRCSATSTPSRRETPDRAWSAIEVVCLSFLVWRECAPAVSLMRGACR